MSTTEPRRGTFLTFEGIDGSGKSTQMSRLSERLRAEGRDVVETVEPGGTAIGRQIRRVLLDARNQEISPATELLLYFASRAQNVDEVIRPAVEAGRVVISDRYTDSTMAYQGFARGVGPEVVAELHRVACRGLDPDLTLYLEVDLETSLARARSRNVAGHGEEAEQVRMDEQPTEFYRKVRDAYREMARREPGRIRVIDGNRDREAIAADIWAAVSEILVRERV